MNSAIEDQIKEAISREEEKHDKKVTFQEAVEKYMKLRELGLLSPLKQKMPPLDTVGRRLHRSLSHK